MSGNDDERDGKEPGQVQFVSLDELVPADHLVRKLEAAIDWSFIYGLVEDKYSQETGRPSLDPVTLIMTMTGRRSRQ